MAARLLIVEDDPALAELLVWHFEAEGYDVTRTADGEEALLLAAEETPDAIILDWMIENLSGIEVCRRLRQTPGIADMPVVMVTALEDEESRWRGIEVEVRRAGAEINLGPTEFRLLQHFMERPGRVLTRGQLVTGVWGHDSDIEERTVDVQIKRLRAALNAQGGKDIIRTVRSAGYSLG